MRCVFALILLLCAVCAPAAALEGDDGASYDVTLPYDVVEGCAWSYIESTPGIVRCADVYTEPGYEDGRETVHYVFYGTAPGETELTFSYVNAQTGERENAYLVKLCVSEELAVTEEDIGVYELSFSSFDGSGTDFTCEVSEEGIVHVCGYRRYRSTDHDKATGSAYDMVYRFSGRAEGTVRVNISSFSPIIEDPGSAEFTLRVDSGLRVHRLPGRLTEFSLGRNSSYYVPSYTFKMDEDGNVLMYIEDSDDDGTVIGGADIMDSIAALMDEYGVADWDGFNETNTDVLDGEGFTLYAVYEDGTKISASGSNAFPEGYSDFRDAIAEIEAECLTSSSRAAARQQIRKRTGK